MSVAWSSSSSSPLLLLSLSSSSRCPPRPPAQLRLAIHSVLCRTSTTTIHAQCSLPDLNHDHPRPVFPAGPQPRPSTPSVPCRTSTTTIHAQCSLPDLNQDHPRPVFPAGPQPRPSTPSVPCRTSTASIHAQCSLLTLVQVVHWLGSVMFVQTCLTGGVLTCLGMFVCLAQVVHWPVWSCLSKPVESSGVYFTWPTDMFISCLTV